jgi:outer membrane receptor for ferrienterochelin and colicins
MDWRPPVEGWLLSASGFHTRLANLINITAGGPPDPDNPAVFSYENVAVAYTQGVELNGRIRLPPRGMYLDLGYMLLDARDVTRRRPLEGRARHRLNAQWTARYRPLGLEAVVRGAWVSRRPFFLDTNGGMAHIIGYGDAREVWAPAYFDLETQVTYQVRNGLRVFANGYNLLGAGDHQLNPRPPRGALGGIQWDYCGTA